MSNPIVATVETPQLAVVDLHLRDSLQVPRCTEFWIPSGDLIVITDRVSFRVHKYMIERETVADNQLFSNSDPALNDATASVLLPGISASAFKLILRTIYRRWAEAVPQWTLMDALDVLPVASELQMVEIYVKARFVISAADELSIASSTKFNLALHCGDYNWAAEVFHNLVESFALIEPALPSYYEEAIVVARHRVARRRHDVATATLLKVIFNPSDYKASPELAGLCAGIFCGEIQMELITKVVTTCHRFEFGRMIATNARPNTGLSCRCKEVDGIAGMEVPELHQAANELIGDLHGEHDIIKEVWDELNHTS